MGINPGHNALCGRFFIAGRPVHLPGQIEIFHAAGLEGRVQQGRVKEIIFHGVGRAENTDLLQPLDGVQRIHLDLEGKRRGEPLQIILVGPPPLRLKEKLVRIVLRKYPQFVLYAGTVARAAAMDQTGKQRRIFKAGAEDLMDTVVRVQDIARHLPTPLLLDRRRFR